jgi:hypothetical protein
VIEIDFVVLIENCLSVVGVHRDRLFRTRLSLVTPLSDSMIRHTHMPVFGRKAHSTPIKSIGVKARLDITRAKGFKTELELLQEFQNLHHFLRVSKTVPSTKIPTLMVALSRFPVISITTLAKEINISRDTAKRWITNLEAAGKLQARDFNGMKQYAYEELISILDRFVRYSAIP